jgi:WD40 repeat protein
MTVRRLTSLGALTLVGALACDRDPRFMFERKPIAEVRHVGFRQDIADERRGNAVFDKALFTREGNYLVTAYPGFRVWNPSTGALLRQIKGTLDGNDRIVVDGTYHRMLARRGNVAPNSPLAPGMGIWDLRDGSLVSFIPETDLERARPVGTTASGEAVVIRNEMVETWALDGSGRRTAIAPPDGLAFCKGGTPNSVTYNDKQCFELSPSGRLLAITAWDDEVRPLDMRSFLVDLATGSVAPIEPSADAGRNGVYGFAFSPDERTLAMGVFEGMWIIPVGNIGVPGAAVRGTFVAGEHKRNRFLTPMAFTADGARIVALGDQLRVSTYDASTGELVGRTEPPFEDWEGALRVSADGSRAVAYRFVGDILVVIDGAKGTMRGYLCPFFCNRFHNPVEVGYAVSPDGRRVASGGRLGAGIWDTDADTLIAPLEDPTLPPRRPRD